MRTQKFTPLLKLHPDRRHRVIGATGSGKTDVSRVCLVEITGNLLGCSQFINLASGSNLPLAAGSGSRTTEVKLADEFTLDGRTVSLIDTPEFGGTSKIEDVLKMVAVFLTTT